MRKNANGIVYFGSLRQREGYPGGVSRVPGKEPVLVTQRRRELTILKGSNLVRSLPDESVLPKQRRRWQFGTTITYHDD